MSSNTKTYQNKLSLGLGRVFLLLALLQSLAALVSETQRLSTIGPEVISKLSPTQIIISLAIIIAIFFVGALLLLSHFQPKRMEGRLAHLATWLNNPKNWARITLLITLIFLGGGFFITLTADISDPLIAGILKRFLPIVLWITGLCVQTLIFLIYARYGFNLPQLMPVGKAFYFALLAIGLIFLGWWWVTNSTLELLQEDPRWFDRGLPIIETQLLLAWLAGMGMLAFMAWATKKRAQVPWIQLIRPPRIDLLVGIFLWIITIILWQSTPLVPGWMVTEPRPPNFENYPNSDAMRYDRASQSHLVGEGFRNFHIGYAYIRRPLLAAFHSLLHIVGGQDYARVVALQTIVLALIPPMVYFLATSLHNRISGIIAATFMMLRVMNTDIMKQLMSDLPSQFMMVCLTLSTVAWAKRNEHVTVYSLISGCILGLTTLVRPEAILLFLPLVAFSGVMQVPKHRFRIWLQNSILLALGTLLVLIPWLWRTWTITGNFTIDSPRLYRIIINQSSRLIGINNPQLPTAVVSDQETDGSPATKAKTANKNKASKDQPIDLKQSAVDTLSHYLHSQVHTILILPTTVRSLDSFIAFQYHHDAERLWDDCCSYDNYLTRLPFWDEWYWRGNFPNQVIIPLILIVLTLATGINIAWKRQKLTGLVPLILGMSYLMIMAFLRTSGSRFILPADWISPLYFSIGLSHISTFIITSTTTLKFDENFGFPTLQKEATKHDANLFRTPKFYAVLIAVTLVGWSLPLFEVSIPQRYTENRTSEMLNGLWDSNQINEETRLILGEFLSQGGSAVTGRGLYPRFFQEESGEPGSNNVFGPRSYPRIGFYLTGPQSQMLVMPFESDQFSFPNESDVVVFACVESTDKLESPWDVLAVAVFNKSSSLETLLLRSPLPSSLNCPLPENATSNPS